MAPLIEQVAAMVKRDDGCGSNYYRASNGICYQYSGWSFWGRWVFAGLAIIFALLVFAGLFRNSRRRRRLGQQPMYGTGWMAPPPPYQPAPPQYSAQDPGNGVPPSGGYKYGPTDGYFGGAGNHYGGGGNPYGGGGGNQEGIELQQPAGTYHRGPEPEYAPPPGPPPPNMGK